MRSIVIFLTGIISLGFSNTVSCQGHGDHYSSTSTLMSAGVANEVYAVRSSTSNPHILKVFHRKTIEELDRAESLLQLVRNAGIAVPESIIPPIQVGSEVISVISYIIGIY